jgi:ribulose-phosphate 3-epimerase
MIEKPVEQVMKYYEAGADYVTFHFEACENFKEVLETLKKQNLKVGLSIKPATSVTVLDEFLPYLDLILVMSVEPGKGGQKFMDSCLDKIDYLVKKRRENNYSYLVEVDGGINLETAKLVKQVGCDAVVAGTYLFKNENFIKATKELGEI